MLKKVLLAALALVCVPNLVLAANEKIDPETYLCAELVSNETLLQGEAPLFEGLQLDGYASAAVNMDVASPDAVHIILNEAVNWCQERPTDKVYSIWQQMRATGPVPEGDWNAKTSTCADFALNQDDASGFIIWLDGYNRKANNTTKSILNSDADCRKTPRTRLPQSSGFRSTRIFHEGDRRLSPFLGPERPGRFVLRAYCSSLRGTLRSSFLEADSGRFFAKGNAHMEYGLTSSPITAIQLGIAG